MTPLASILAILAFAALGLLLQHERKQARKLVERSKELERLSTELLRASRMKNEFLANVSHELRTPLNAIVGFVDLLREGVYGDLAPKQVKPVERIEASANHLRHLVDQILDLAKMAAGRLEVHRESLDLRVFLLDVVSEVESLAREKNLGLSVNLESLSSRVRSDPLHLRQILMNLLGNAIKYTREGGIVVRSYTTTTPSDDVRDGDSNKWVVIEIKATGIGIHEADQ